jgi:hypothetical protein
MGRTLTLHGHKCTGLAFPFLDNINTIAESVFATTSVGDTVSPTNIVRNAASNCASRCFRIESFTHTITLRFNH